MRRRPLLQAISVPLLGLPAAARAQPLREMRNLRTAPLTVATMRHEIDYVRSSGVSLPGLDRLDPAALLPGY